MQLSALEDLSLSIASFAATVLLLLVTALVSWSKRIFPASKASIKAFDKTKARRGQKQSEALIALTQLPLHGERDWLAAIEEIAQTAANALEGGQVSVWLEQEDGVQLVCAVAHPPPFPPTQRQRGKTDRAFGESCSAQNAYPALEIPICRREQRVGLLRCEPLPDGYRSWTPGDRQFAGAVANCIASILETERREQRLKTQCQSAETALLEQSRLSTLAAKVGIALANGGTLSASLQTCAEVMVQQLQALSAAIWVWNAQSQQLEPQATAGKPIAPSRDCLNTVLQTRQPFNPTDSPTTALSAYPLLSEERLMGVLVVSSERALTEAASHSLSWMSNAIAVAIDRHRARTQLLSRRESLLFELAHQIRNSLELDTILETAVQSIHSLLQIDRCHFLWYRPHEFPSSWEVVNEARHPHLPSHVGRYSKTQMGSCATPLLERQIVQIDRVETFADTAGREFLCALGYTSLLLIPVETRTGEIGAIACGHCTSGRPWGESEVELLKAVVVQLAIALDQAELYARTRQVALRAQDKARELELALQQLKTAQTQLVQSEKMSSLGQLVAGVAHEINNPVNFIHGNLTYASAYIYDLLNLLQLYRAHYPQPPQTILEQAEVMDIDFIAQDLPKLLRSMQLGTDRIRSIVLSLRNFARLDEASVKPVDVHEGIDSTLLILQHRLKAKNQFSEIQIIKDYGNLPLIECYPGQLNQVFLSILSNAIEAFEHSFISTPQRPQPTITIRTSLREDFGRTPYSPAGGAGDCANCQEDRNQRRRPTTQTVVIQITDNGPGMTDFVKGRLFDPFFTTKAVGEGTGMGLSISYQIVVERHHGMLTCTSALAQGSEFRIEIPVKQTPIHPMSCLPSLQANISS